FSINGLWLPAPEKHRSPEFHKSGHVGKHPRQLKNLPPLRFGNRIICTHELQCLLVGEDIPLDVSHRIFVQSFEKEIHRNVQRVPNVPQAGCRNPVHPGFVFLDLLEFDPDLIRKLLLSNPDHPPTMTNSLANMDIYTVFHCKPSLQSQIELHIAAQSTAVSSESIPKAG